MKKIKYGLTVCLILMFILMINRFNIFENFSPVDIKNFVTDYGVYAPLIYILLFTVVPLTFFPDSFLAIASGMIFGLTGGFIYTMIGALCGATFAFYIARLLRSERVIALIKAKASGLENSIEKKGFFIILLLRLIPLFPMDAISYSAGFSSAKYRDFISATALGTIPGILVFTNIGDKSLDVNSSAFYLSIALLLLLFMASFFLKKKFSLKD